jgi:hypothetical protein
LIIFTDDLPVSNRQVDSQPRDGQFVVRRLTASFRGGSFNAGGQVLDENACFDFIAVLAARTAAALTPDFASGQQIVIALPNWMCRSNHPLVIIRGAMTDQAERYLPDHQFPAYSYVPGRFPHPKQTHGHGCPGPTEIEFCESLPANWSRCQLYLWGFDLFNHRYYWEAHEAWEGAWIADGRKGTTADYLKGLIKLAAAGVKAREGRVAGVRRHAQRAAELFQNTQAAVGHNHYCGSDLSLLERLAKQVSSTPESFINTSDAPVARVFPLKIALDTKGPDSC